MLKWVAVALMRLLSDMDDQGDSVLSSAPLLFFGGVNDREYQRASGRFPPAMACVAHRLYGEGKGIHAIA
jgi:hypothetical protein